MTDVAPQHLRKKLIEVSIPLEAINVASAREKSIRHGHPSTLHLWWARRPLAACRAVLFAQLVDDPSSWPERFPTEEMQDAERRRLHKVIADLVPWEASTNERILDSARWEIARSVAWGLGEEPPESGDGAAVLDYLQTKAPPVYDPFSGGGSIPLEAQRLGLRAYGSDLNPVAVLIGKSLIEIPPKFAGLPPINPSAQGELRRGGKWNSRGAEGLAEDVRYYGQWIRGEAEKRIGHRYPKAVLADGSSATVIAWLWCRTVRSPDPSAKGAMVPLVSSYMLCTKPGKTAWIEPVTDPDAQDGWRFEVRMGKLAKAEEDRLKLGTKAGKGQAFTCVLTGATINRSYIQEEGKFDRLGVRLLAIVADGGRGRVYLSPNAQHEAAATELDKEPAVAEARNSFLSPATPTRAMITGGVCTAYGLRTWGHLFTARQLVVLTTLSDLVSEARAKAAIEARDGCLPPDDRSLRDGGVGAEAYADSLATLLALSIGRATNRASTLCIWNQIGEKIEQVFRRQSLPMVFDFPEGNLLSESTGSYIEGGVSWIEKCIAVAPAIGKTGIVQLDAKKNQYPVRPAIISTDPPYFDNIGYSEISDFFYVWHRRAIANLWPDLFRRITTPKDDELVVLSARHKSRDMAETFFMEGMGEALGAIREASVDLPVCIYYAFKQTEVTADGVTSAGWAAFLQAITNSGFLIDGTWPIRTERSGGLRDFNSNALASSIVLVCRKRSLEATVVVRAEFIRVLKRELPQAIEAIRKAGVGAP
ncbi:DUF1156 domain-containing protein [Bradyrhizobium elkanii]|uniref:DUF1156 domain-containing protein n=1 Tax=Bradyrhizobium elkanii TaxID=29448 RepID=UPI003516A0B5